MIDMLTSPQSSSSSSSFSSPSISPLLLLLVPLSFQWRTIFSTIVLLILLVFVQCNTGSTLVGTANGSYLVNISNQFSSSLILPMSAQSVPLHSNNSHVKYTSKQQVTKTALFLPKIVIYRVCCVSRRLTTFTPTIPLFTEPVVTAIPGGDGGADGGGDGDAGGDGGGGGGGGGRRTRIGNMKIARRKMNRGRKQQQRTTTPLMVDPWRSPDSIKP